MNSKEHLLMSSLTQFFKDKENLNKMLKIVNDKSKISLRIMDWFVTNYAKKNCTSYNKNDNKFIVHLEYKSQLKAYSKKQFDPFRRNERIEFIDLEGNKIETTVGQLNFFRWAIENGIIDYIDDNLEIIDNDMNTILRNHYKTNTANTNSGNNPQNKCRRKRQELSVSATKTVKKHETKIIVKFD